MSDPITLAEAVRKACIEAALAAYEDAGVSGLCAEGRWEAAIGALQSLNLRSIAPCEESTSVGMRSGSGAA